MDTLETNLSDYVSKSEAKPYEVNLTIKITDMNQFLNDLKTLVKNNWKIILLSLAIVFFISNYTEIKSGIIDGWNQK
jgi:hypothetical protein